MGGERAVFPTRPGDGVGMTLMGSRVKENLEEDGG